MQMLDMQQSTDLTTADWVARARALVPTIAAAAPRIEIERKLPDDLVEALHAAGMYRMLIPRSLGGGEAKPVDAVRAIEIIASVDASTAWCVGQGGGCAMSAAYLPEDGAREVFGPRDAVLAWGPPKGPARADVVEGGFRLNGTWHFASGSRHATWLAGGAPVFEADGSPRLDLDGKPLTLQLLFPRSAASITDVWQVVGLRGTGSDTYAVHDLLIPERHAYFRDVRVVREPGPLYHFSVINLFALMFPAIALGIARTMLDDFIALAIAKTPRRGSNAGGLRDNAAIQGQVGLAEARLRAARTLHYATLETAWEEAQTHAELSLERRVEMRMSATYAIQTAKDVADFAYTASGTNAIFENGPFERRFRDIHAVTQQVQGHAANLESVGAYYLGLPVTLTI
jgi:indole-3-acetate monooxygenase